MERKFEKRKKLMIVSTILLVLLTVGISLFLITPKNDNISTEDLPESYMIINDKNYVQFQSKNDCAGYATAYVLRHLGEEVEGAQLHVDMSFKVGNGVSLRGVRKSFKDYGYKVTSYTGTIDTLKKQLTKGIPVVAFITINENGHHYVAVVGYDKNCIYLADSTGAASNTVGCLQYNRRVTYEQFEELWKTNVYPANNIYTVVEVDGNLEKREKL